MTIAVVDDFEPDRQGIAMSAGRFLAEHNGPPPQFFFYSSGGEFLDGFSSGAFDMVLLDCLMEGMDGMETAREMRKVDEKTSLVFITSCRDFAVDGYMVSAAGYLVKPYTYDTFSHVFGNAFNRLPARREMIAVLDGQNRRRIMVNDIVYCDAVGHYVQFYLRGSGMMRARMTFSALTELLAPYPQFLPCYRGCMINMAHTYQTEELNFVMDNGDRVPFRKKERERLIQRYHDYLFDKVRQEI